MKTIFGLVLILFAGFLNAAPVTSDDETVEIDKDFYPLEFVKYKGDHDIVNLLVPINSLNFDEDDSSESDSNESDGNVVLFFVEADVTDDGKRVDQGLYVLKDNKATKLLDHGRDAAASGDDSKSVFLAAKDGIYVYKDGKTEKYGPITDSIIQIAKEKSGDVLYILTEDHVLYKVSDNGNKKEELKDIENPQEFVLDYNNNIYYYSSDKEVKVHTSEGTTKIHGLPANLSNLKLIKPPFILEDGVPLIVDNSVYVIYANGTSEAFGVEFKPKYKPSAYAAEAGLIQYYAYDKKIYEYNFVAMLLGTALEELQDYLKSHEETIRSLASSKKATRVH